MSSVKKTIDLVYFNAGGGHRSAALALQEVVRLAQRAWSVRLVNLFEILDPNGTFRKVTGVAPEDLYNFRLKRGWTLGLSTELKVLQSMIRMGHPTLLSKLEQHWQTHKTDLVVSLVPNFNKVLYQSIKSQRPGVPFVTVMTDLADSPPNFWIEPGLNQQIVCGTARAVDQAHAAGYSDKQISRTSGMILRPAFYNSVALDREQERCKLGLEPGRTTGIVMFGGHGSSQMLRIAKSLTDVQLIFMCGHNSALAAQLNALQTSANHIAIGFTPNIERYMKLADFFIGKPGPGSLSEAVQMNLPVITFKNAWTMPQERYNTTWVEEQGVGIVVTKQSALSQSVGKLIDNLQTFRMAAARIQNRAVFEVTDILALQLASADATVLERLDEHSTDDLTAPCG